LLLGSDLDRRSRKKLRTREALADAAIQLFTDVGFEETTIEAIADVVDVSRRTFHRYFPCKEDVLFADAPERLELFRAALQRRARSEPVLASVRAAVAELAAALSARPDELAAAVTEFAAERAEAGTDPAWPSLVGACTLAVVTAMRRQWMAAAEDDGGQTLAEAFDHGFDVLISLSQSIKSATP
jgi:AcrR family transcriptional regulator